MSDYTPTARDIRLALLAAGFTENEATSALDKVKRRGIGIGHEMAREATQASIGGAFREAQRKAWDEGYEAAARYHDLDTEFAAPNPYRDEAGL